MEKKSQLRLIILSLFVVACCNFQNMYGQTYIRNIYGALARVNPAYNSYTFNRNGTILQDTYSEYHIQGIAFENGYYYIVRSRPDASNNQKLLVINESTATVVNKLTLDVTSSHPGGIQIHNGVLAIPFEVTNQNAKINFYSLSNPITPTLLSSFTTDKGSAICVGITDYEGKNLVAHYYGRTGVIRFYHFDQSFNKVAQKTWYAADQDKSDWYPFNVWDSTEFNYESMSLVKTLESPTATPIYYMIMYHKSNAADVFELSDPNLTSDLNVKLVYRLELPPNNTGFRYGGGLAITDSENLRFFSTLKHVYDATSSNIISKFDSRTSWPWKLPYSYDTGGQMSITMDDNGNCIEMHRGRDGGGNQNNIYYKVGKIDFNTNKIEWGSNYNTGITGEFISVEMNNNGYCVEMHCGVGTDNNQHYYRVGQINTSTKTISWGAEYTCGTGGYMSVALDDNNHVVELHRGRIDGENANNHYYGIGSVNTTTKTITWKTGGTLYDTGGSISLALDNNGNCLETHRGSPDGENEYNRYYKKGVVNFNTGVITWAGSVKYDTGGDGVIAVSNNGNCIEVHRGRPGGSKANNHYYKIGTFNFSNNTVSWSSVEQYGTGGIISVAMDNNGNGIGVNIGDDGYTLNYRTVKCSISSSLKTRTYIHNTENDSKQFFLDKISVYPNPAVTSAHIMFTSKNTGQIIVEILDLTGRVMMQKAIGHYQKGEAVNEEIISSQQLTSGIYFVRVKENGNSREMSRLYIR